MDARSAPERQEELVEVPASVHVDRQPTPRIIAFQHQLHAASVLARLFAWPESPELHRAAARRELNEVDFLIT